MGVSNLAFTSIKTKAVDNVQRWENKASDIPQSVEKQMTQKTIILTFCFIQPWTRNQSECTNVSNGKEYLQLEEI